MLKTKHRLNIRNRRLLRNKKSIKRNELIKVSRSNQEEWSKGVTQWFTRRQIKRINNKYRLQIASCRQSSEEEWKEGFDEWSDQKILRKANRWLNRMRASGRIIPRKNIQRINSKTRRKISTNLYPKQAYQKYETRSDSHELKNERKNTENKSNDIDESEFYLYKDEKQFGPHSFSEIQDLASNGDISPKDLTFFKGCNDWVEANNIPGITFKLTDKSEKEIQEEDEIPPHLNTNSNDEKRMKTSSEIRASNDEKRKLSPRFSILSLIFIIMILIGITFIIFDRIQSLENELSSRIDEWDKELAFLKDPLKSAPIEANSTIQSKVAIQMEDLGETTNSIPQANIANHVFELVINPDLDKLRELSVTLSRSISEISSILKKSNESMKERDALLSFLNEFDTQIKLVCATTSSNEVALKQNLRAFTQTLIFLKKISEEISIKGKMKATELRKISNQLEPVKQGFQTQAVKMFDAAFGNYPEGKHVRMWTDKGGNQIKGYLWAYNADDDLMVLVKDPSTEKEILKFTSSEMKFSQLDQDYFNSFLAWRSSCLNSYLLNPPEMVFIKSGKFFMGSFALEENRNQDELRHEVNIGSDFLMGKYEVSVGEWFAVMGKTYTGRNNENFYYQFTSPFSEKIAAQDLSSHSGLKFFQYPVNYIPIDHAELFCKKLTEIERGKGRLPKGKIYRLPTEAEWEYACRAGTQSPFFWGGNAENLEDYVAKSILPIGSKKPNNWGLHDMMGSVGEYLADQPRIYTKNLVLNPHGILIEKTKPNVSGSNLYYKSGFIRGQMTNKMADFRSARRPSKGYVSLKVGFRFVLASPLKL